MNQRNRHRMFFIAALPLTRKAAAGRDASAQLDLGDAYYVGDGVNQDYREAEKWYRKAAPQGRGASLREAL